MFTVLHQSTRSTPRKTISSPTSRQQYVEQLAKQKRNIVTKWDPSALFSSVGINRESMREQLTEFLDVWDRRPLKENLGGMGFDHQFNLWFVAKTLQPKLIIESGMKSGATTWLLREAVPEAHIISFDPTIAPDWVSCSS
jgi:hypothetical protein